MISQGKTPKSRAVGLQGCLKVVAQGMEQFSSLDKLFDTGLELYNKVINFANEPIKYDGCINKIDLAKINKLILAEMPEPNEFWNWLSEKPNMEYLIDGDDGVNPRLLKVDHATYLLDNIQTKLDEYNQIQSGGVIATPPKENTVSSDEGEQTTFLPPQEDDLPPF